MNQWFYGRQSVFEILDSNLRVQKIILARGVDLEYSDEIMEKAKSKGIPVRQVQKSVLDSMISGNHQGVAVEAEPAEPTDFKSFLASLEGNKKCFVCLLDEIQDPQNLGAIMRGAVCFGCAGIIIPGRRSAKLTSSVMKSSSGAFAHLPVAEVSNLGVAMERLKEKGFWIFGTDVEAGEPLNQLKFDFPLALVLGNEHRGVKPVLKKNCDRLVSIPQAKKIASLNVSSAASILFYEIHKQMA